MCIKIKNYKLIGDWEDLFTEKLNSYISQGYQIEGNIVVIEYQGHLKFYQLIYK